MKVRLKKDMTILFQGDSITDCGRREPAYQPLGRGFVSVIAHWLWAQHPELNMNIINRGISGNRVRDLVSRWESDCVEIKPDVLSILIGINEVLRRYDSSDPTSVEDFEKNYRTILQKATETSNPTLIICEPFLLPHPPGIEAYREDLDPKIIVVRELAREFNAIYIPYDGVFAAASTRAKPSYWAEDGVHPTPQAHALMAQEWMRLTGVW